MIMGVICSYMRCDVVNTNCVLFCLYCGVCVCACLPSIHDDCGSVTGPVIMANINWHYATSALISEHHWIRQPERKNDWILKGATIIIGYFWVL